MVLPAKRRAVFDPFAGGSVRGIVAAVLGRHYTGVDLRPEQIAANVEQAQQSYRITCPVGLWATAARQCRMSSLILYSVARHTPA